MSDVFRKLDWFKNWTARARTRSLVLKACAFP